MSQKSNVYLTTEYRAENGRFRQMALVQKLFIVLLVLNGLMQLSIGIMMLVNF